MVVRDVLAADAGLDDVEHVLRAQAVARHGLAVHLDLEVRLALHARGRDAGRAGNLAHDALDLERLLLQRVEIVAENLHADLRADAGAEHEDAVLDRLEESRARSRARASASRVSSAMSFSLVMPVRAIAMSPA